MCYDGLMVQVLTQQTPITEPSDGRGELVHNHALYLHAMILMAMAPYNVRLSSVGEGVSTEDSHKALARTSKAAAKALGVPDSELEVGLNLYY